MRDLKAALTSEAEDDQASGLRRLFGARAAQVIAFVAAGESCGRTTLLVKTASALARTGLAVVLIDENSDVDNVHAAYGVTARHDLFDLVQSQQSPQQIIQMAAPRVSVVAAHRFARELHPIDQEAAERLDSGLRQLQQGAAFILIDCASRKDGDLSSLALAAQHIAVVVAAQSEAITHAYALIKRLTRERGRDGLHIVVTRARNELEATAIFQNMRRTAQDHLGVRLEYLGGAQTPGTDHLADVLKSRLPLGESGDSSTGFSPFLASRRLRWPVPGRSGWPRDAADAEDAVESVV